MKKLCFHFKNSVTNQNKVNTPLGRVNHEGFVLYIVSKFKKKQL